MSNNGKKGEMECLEIVSKLGQLDTTLDCTRPTNTNTADCGCDVCVEHTEQNFNEILDVAAGKLSTFSNDGGSFPMKTRIDVKSTSRKITKHQTEKFISDVRKNPDCKGHMLWGGSDMTKGAKQVFEQAQKDYLNKSLAYINNDGAKNIKFVIDNQLLSNNSKSIENN